MRRILLKLCSAASLWACGPSGPPGPYIPSSAEHPPAGGLGGWTGDVPSRDGQEIEGYAERPRPARWCWLMSSGTAETQLYEVDLDTAEWGVRKTLPAGGVVDKNCFTVQDEKLIWLGYPGVNAWDLGTNAIESWEAPDRHCLLTSNSSEIIATCGLHGLCAYAGLDQLVDGSPTREIAEYPAHELFALGPNALYAAGIITETVNVRDPVSLERRQTILLEEVGLEVLGFAVTSEHAFLHDGWLDQEHGLRLATYDLATGDNEDNLYLVRRTGDRQRFDGLYCGENL